ncbi:MAG: TFIIB-type zinc ribbon-containing protein [Lachnospiraceae bacterium]|nr:TFIIB-type zinc ribbon-containing protein [Lachnospiraceae bacterium]
MVFQYKCPDCGADLKFDANQGMIACENCGHTEKVEEMTGDGQLRQSTDTDHQDVPMEDSSVVSYQCQNCGAFVMTDKNTTATKCSFCQAPIILGDRLEGMLKPDYCIPFKIDRQTADLAFKKWAKRLRFSPMDFRKSVKVKKVEGLYAPFWVYNCIGQGEAMLKCTTSHHYTEGSYDVTETNHYDVYRSVDTTFKGIPADASERLEDRLMDIMEPFDYSQLVKFEAPYLTGYLAEKYDYTDKEMFPRVQKRVSNYMDSYILDSVHGYDTKNISERHYNINRSYTSYCLFPIWINYVTYKDKDYSFAMNAETGKIAGKPPISVPNVLAHIGVSTVAIFILLRLLVVLLGGTFLW